jgi:hypothetical protein
MSPEGKHAIEGLDAALGELERALSEVRRAAARPAALEPGDTLSEGTVAQTEAELDALAAAVAGLREAAGHADEAAKVALGEQGRQLIRLRKALAEAPPPAVVAAGAGAGDAERAAAAAAAPVPGGRARRRARLGLGLAPGVAAAGAAATVLASVALTSGVTLRQDRSSQAPLVTADDGGAAPPLVVGGGGLESPGDLDLGGAARPEDAAAQRDDHLEAAVSGVQLAAAGLDAEPHAPSAPDAGGGGRSRAYVPGDVTPAPPHGSTPTAHVSVPPAPEPSPQPPAQPPPQPDPGTPSPSPRPDPQPEPHPQPSPKPPGPSGPPTRPAGNGRPTWHKSDDRGPSKRHGRPSWGKPKPPRSERPEPDPKPPVVKPEPPKGDDNRPGRRRGWGRRDPQRDEPTPRGRGGVGPPSERVSGPPGRARGHEKHGR